MFQKHKLNIRAPTRINPVNRFGETMFRYTRARLAENERTRCLLMEAYIRVRLGHFRDEAYTHYTNHGPHFREFARLIEGDWENILKQYNADKAAPLLEKRHEEECKDKLAQPLSWNLMKPKTYLLCTKHDWNAVIELPCGAICFRQCKWRSRVGFCCCLNMST